MSSTYTVKVGETIGDVVLNASGSIANWDAILTANGFTDWTPALIPGQVLIIPDGLTIDLNSQRQLANYPAANSITNSILANIANVFNTIFNNWILQTTYWNDVAVWIDIKTWND